MADISSKVATDSCTDVVAVAVAVDEKGKTAAPVEKPSNKRAHEAMAASSTEAGAVAVETRVEKPSSFPCTAMKCSAVFASEKALCGHMKMHTGRAAKVTNPPTEAPPSTPAGNGGVVDEAGSGRKKMKKGLPFDLNELPPPEEEDDAVKKIKDN